MLERAGDSLPADFIRLLILDFTPFKKDLAPVSAVEAADHLKQRRFSSAVRADQADNLSLGNLQIDVFICGQATIILGQALHLEQCGILLHFSLPSFLSFL